MNIQNTFKDSNPGDLPLEIYITISDQTPRFTEQIHKISPDYVFHTANTETLTRRTRLFVFSNLYKDSYSVVLIGGHGYHWCALRPSLYVYRVYR